MAIAIQKLVEEDPTLRVKTDVETGQTVLSGMGELHLDIIVDRLKRDNVALTSTIGYPAKIPPAIASCNPLSVTGMYSRG